MTPLSDSPNRSLGGLATTSALVVIAIAMTWALVWTDVNSAPTPTNWPVFGALAVMLLACSRLPSTWIRFGAFGVVTPLWMFSYALLLLGTPSAGVAVAVVGSTVQAMSHVESIGSIINRVAGTAFSLSSAAMVLTALGAHGSVTGFEQLPLDWSVAIMACGITILTLNAITASIMLAVRRRSSFVSLFQHGIGVRVTAEGAMLSLAPLWVIGVDFSPMLFPLLLIATMLVFRSTRQALEQSHEAHHDALTGMSNRRAFFAQLDEVLLAATPNDASHVLIMDLNGFKDINDRLGHQLGDALLVAFADQLERSLPSGAVAARLGGDEFAVLIVTTGDHSSILETVSDMRHDLSHPLLVEGFPVTVGVSIGVATSPADGRTSRDLVRAADIAMYRAKRTGTAIETYDNCVQGPQRGRLNLLGDLNDAVARDDLYLHFQPQLRLSDGSVETIEALIRWEHPDHGLIPPGEFVGLAEQTDLIGPITEMVLREATYSLLEAHAPDVKLAVNISARSLQDQHFAPMVFSILAETGFPASRLELEVTERDLVANTERTIYTISQLRMQGIRIAIDDFGVGYSSFQTLRLLDVDRVKIDRDFVSEILTQPRDRLIVASVINLAHELGLDVVAEGVESAAVWNALGTMDCDVAQGFGLAVPMPITELRSWLTQWAGPSGPSRFRTAVDVTAQQSTSQVLT